MFYRKASLEDAEQIYRLANYYAPWKIEYQKQWRGLDKKEVTTGEKIPQEIYP